MPFHRGTATDYKDLLLQLKQIATSDHVATAAVSAAGTGYSVGDVLTASGGTSTHAAQFKVTSVGGSGEVTGLRVHSAGAYTSNPSSPVSTTGGGGSGCTVTVTFASSGWTARLDTTTGGERQLILEGTGAGSDSIFVGARTYQVGASGAHNWELAGMTGYSSGVAWADQPGISPGRYEDALNKGAYVPLQDASTTFWLAVTPSRITGVARVGTNYSSWYMGFLNPFSTTTEWPYPLAIVGSTADYDLVHTSSGLGYSGITDPQTMSASLDGPFLWRRADGSWSEASNALGTGTRTSRHDVVVYPAGQPLTSVTNLPEVADEIVTDGYFSWEDVVPQSGNPGTSSVRVKPTPGSGGGTIKVPATVVESDTDGGRYDVVGELDGVFWVPGDGLTAEDELLDGSKALRVFQSGNRSDEFAMFAVEED